MNGGGSRTRHGEWITDENVVNYNVFVEDFQVIDAVDNLNGCLA